MASNFVFKVNGVNAPTPSKFSWSIMDVSSSDAGRTSDGIMHKNRISQKEKIQLEWAYPKPSVASTILQMFNSEYFEVTYRSPLTNSTVTKTFYRGDSNSPYYWWVQDGLMENVSFDIIER